VRPTLTFDVPASDFIAVAHDRRAWIDLNLPSIDAVEMPAISPRLATAST
jgi:hypothetical protein